MLRVQSVPVFVEDQERALTFYRDVLGFQVLMDYQMTPDFRWVIVVSPDGGAEVILYCPAQSVNGDAEQEIRQRIGQWTGIILSTDNIQEVYQDLVAHGVSFTSAPRLQPWGVYETIFTDLDGNQLHLVQRPTNITFESVPQAVAASN